MPPPAAQVPRVFAACGAMTKVFRRLRRKYRNFPPPAVQLPTLPLPAAQTPEYFAACGANTRSPAARGANTLLLPLRGKYHFPCRTQGTENKNKGRKVPGNPADPGTKRNPEKNCKYFFGSLPSGGLLSNPCAP